MSMEAPNSLPESITQSCTNDPERFFGFKTPRSFSGPTTADQLPAPFTAWAPFPNEYPPILPPIHQPGSARYVVTAQQPLIPVPLYQDVHHRDKIVEVPQTVVQDTIHPRLFQQDVEHDVPRLQLDINPKPISIRRNVFREKVIEVPIPVGFKYTVVNKWHIREVPKVIPKYEGPVEEIFVEVPQIEVVDRNVEREEPIYVGSKVVPKLVIEEVPEDVVEYKYVKQEEEVPVYKFKPVIDVQVEIPPPLVVPVPVGLSAIDLEPERTSLSEWKRLRESGDNPCCNSSCCSSSCLCK